VEDACDKTRKRRYARRTVEYSNTLITTSLKKEEKSVMTSYESAFCVRMEEILKTIEKPGETGSRKKNVRVHT